MSERSPFSTRVTCTVCGDRLQPDDSFCGMCGARVNPCARCGNALLAGDERCANCDSAVDPSSITSPAASAWDDGEPSAWTGVLERLQQATLGDFQVFRELGRGGMAAVFLAHDIHLDRKVAIKVMSPALAQDPSMVERFRKEARTGAGLKHPNIAAVYQVLDANGLHFFVMDFVRGRSLEAILKSSPRLPLPIAQTLLHQAGSGLAYAHRHKVYHRDVKPGNILVSAVDGSAVVTDFGIAKVAESQGLTQTGSVVGTPAYMAPEQIMAIEITGAADQYALGIVAFEMLTGAPPFMGSPYSVMHAHMDTVPPALCTIRPDCPPEVEAALARMLAKKPEDRWPTLSQALVALGATPLVEDHPVRIEVSRLARPTPSELERQSTRTPMSPVPPSRSAASNTPARPSVVPASPPEKQIAGTEVGVRAHAELQISPVTERPVAPGIGKRKSWILTAGSVLAVAAVGVAVIVRLVDPPVKPVVQTDAPLVTPASPPSSPSSPADTLRPGVPRTGTRTDNAVPAGSPAARDSSRKANAPIGKLDVPVKPTEPIHVANAEKGTGRGLPNNASDPTPPIPAKPDVRDSAKSITTPAGAAKDTVTNSPRPSTTFRTITAGLATTCGLADDGHAFCWGGGEKNPAPIGGRSFTRFEVGRSHRCGLAGGTAYCWGGNKDGQLGDGSTTERTAPTPVSGSLEFTEIAAGGSHTCALDAAGAAYCWGANDMGQLGDGSTHASHVPVKVKANAAFRSIVTGKAHTCALTADGRAFCWGDGWSGALGNGIKAAQAAPFPVDGDLRFRKLAAGDEHTCGLTSANKAYCWGDNRQGQDGDARNSEKTKPSEVARMPAFVDVAVGGYHSCGLADSGNIYCWGANKSGQLGNGTTTSEKVPVVVKTEERFTKLAAGEEHTCAVSRDRVMYCWGLNAQGQLGDGTTATQTTPVPVRTKN